MPELELVWLVLIWEFGGGGDDGTGVASAHRTEDGAHGARSRHPADAAVAVVSIPVED